MSGAVPTTSAGDPMGGPSPDPWDGLAEAACACCRAQVRLRHLLAVAGAGPQAGLHPACVRSAEEAARTACAHHLRLRRDLLGC